MYATPHRANCDNDLWPVHTLRGDLGELAGIWLSAHSVRIDALPTMARQAAFPDRVRKIEPPGAVSHGSDDDVGTDHDSPCGGGGCLYR
jgi:hypothetical protein